MGPRVLISGTWYKLSIEIGTQFGGSLQAIAKYSNHVYSIDIDASVPKLLDGHFPNVEYLTGDSDLLLPELVDTIQNNSDAPLSFVLIDGDHSADAVRKRHQPSTAISSNGAAIYIDARQLQSRLPKRHARGELGK